MIGQKLIFKKTSPAVCLRIFHLSLSTADNKHEKNQLCETKEQRTQVPYKRSFQDKMLNV